LQGAVLGGPPPCALLLAALPAARGAGQPVTSMSESLPAPQWFGGILRFDNIWIGNPPYRPDSRRQHKPRSAAPGGLLTAAQAAAKLGCSIKTLNGHITSGAIGYVITGHGTKRPRKMFTDADLDQFIAAQTRKDSPCPSTASRARHSGTSTSSGAVIDFTAPRKPPTDDKRKK
jgi:hypothetical protein